MTHTMLESWCSDCGFISTMNGCGWPHERDEDDLRDSPPNVESIHPESKPKIMSQNQTESKPASVEDPREEGLDGTPITDDCTGPCICHAVGLGDQEDACPREKMAEMERQRNAAWKTLKEIRELFTADESFGATVEALFAKPLEEAEEEIARLQSLLNAKVVAPPTLDSDSK